MLNTDRLFWNLDNHKPTLSDDLAPSSATVKPSSTSGSYDLSFTDEGGKYAYKGTRSTKENQYVLIFDPDRKAFVLHRLDSTLNMNLIRTPTNTDADALKEEYPHLDSPSTIRVSTDKKRPGGGAGKGKGKASAKNAGMVETKRSAAPAKAKAEPAAEKKEERRARSPVDSVEDEEDDDDSDDGLRIEYPDPQPAASVHGSYTRPEATHQHSELGVRRFSTFNANADESDEDADAEYDEDDLLGDEAGDSSAGDGFKLPSPVGRNGAQHLQEPDAGEEPEVDDLEALLAQELEGDMDVDSESSVSEED